MTTTKENFEKTRELFNPLKYYEKTKNKMDAEEILKMLEREIPLQVKISALIAASTPDNANNTKKALSTFKNKLKKDPDNMKIRETVARLERELQESSQEDPFKDEKRIKKDITYLENELKKNPDDESAKRMLERLTEELKNGEYGYKYDPEFVNLLDENKLRERLLFLFAPYLDFLDENDKSRLQEALNLIEQNISKRDEILSEMKAQLQTKGIKATEKANIKKVNKLVTPVDKVSQKLFTPEENQNFYDTNGVLVEVGKKNKKPVDTAVSVIFDKDKDLSFSNDIMLDQYNNAVHSAVCSMYNAGNNIFTINALYRFMSGNSSTVKAPGEKTVEEIKNSLRKMSFTRIFINTENEAQKFKQIPIKIKKIERSLLHVDFITANVNGQDVEAVRILAKPPLLEYAEYKNQIASYDTKILNVPLSSTREHTIIKNYLLAQILIMKNPKSKRNNVIRYDTVYKNLELDAPTEETLRAKKRDVRGKVHVILEHWKKEGLIKGYSEDIKEGKEIAKVEIYF